MKSSIFKQAQQFWKINLWTTTLIILHSFFSCTNDALEIALEKAGKNRREMEKVLEYFHQSPEDSLKYRAARFLIENMPGQITYSNDSINRHMQKCNPPYSYNRWFACLQVELLQIRHTSQLEHNKLQETKDIENLTSKFLIEHIETVFRKLKDCPWSQEIDFEDFCEYLLPYRIGQERVFLWRDSTLNGFDQLQNYIMNYTDIRTSIQSLSKKLPYIVRIPWCDVLSLLPPPMYGYHLDCEDTAIRNLILYRLCNIPATIDMVPCWGNYNGQHAWAQPIDKRRRCMFELDKFSWTTIPKVYRRTYSQQPIVTKTNEFIPPFFQDRHLKDVTDEYLYTVEVEEKCFPENTHYGYLCVFNRGKWLPVAQSINNSGKCTFHKMGPGVVYLPVYYKNNDQFVAISDPFRLTNKGEKIYFSASEKKEDLLLERKYPINSALLANPTTNIIIEASHSFSLLQCDTFKINKNLLMRPFDIKVNPTHRYFRISSMNKDMVAEIYFLKENNKRVFAYTEKTNNKKDILQDNNILTYGYIHPTIFSLNPADTVTSIRVLPHNDGNGIYPGDEYELFYFNKEKQWISCGYKTADNYSIKFENVPQGALYWLQNLTTGKEERIFTYENGHQRFW